MKRSILCLFLCVCLIAQAALCASAEDGFVSGTLEKRPDYDLATVRCELSDGSYFFVEFEETADGYRYRFPTPDGAYTVLPEYYCLSVWDGAVDISWYDAEQTTFYLETPAQLAGLAALVNGQVDAQTPDYRIKGDRSELVSTRDGHFLLVGAGGGNQYGTVYLSDAAHDFSDKTVYLTADMDMGGTANWTPIGGKYPMDAANSETVIEAFFNGVLDGQGHRITRLFCDRYAAKGYAYSQAVGLIGYLGELRDGEAAPQTAPAVRNLSVSGSVYGRRMVGGIVGRTGSIPTGVFIENCANFASVRNTDSKGVGGIVGACWSKGAIVNCYNAGDVTTVHACPAGGICGNNDGMDIYNCYNVGKIDSSGNARGRAIGGHNGGQYTVSDCYYLSGCDDDPASGGWYTGGSPAVTVSVQALSAAELQTAAFVEKLNCNGVAYAFRENGYPQLLWEQNAAHTECTVRIEASEGGTVLADCGGSVPSGSVLHLSAEADTGWAFRYYTLNGSALSGRYATVAQDSVLSAVFAPLTSGALYLERSPYCAVTVTKNGTALVDGQMMRVTNYPVADGDPLYEGDELTATASLLPNAVPEDLDYVFSGKFRYTFAYQDASASPKSTDTGKFTVDSKITSASLKLSVEPYTTHKLWTQLAQTDWYQPECDTFVLTTARQLAGLAKLVKEGNSFAGKTVRLGAAISLRNDDATFNRSVRWFDGIGSLNAPFSGTFDGCGYAITDMTAVSAGSGSALFLATDGAVLRNITVSGEVQANGSAAGVVAHASGTTLTNCVSHAAIVSTGERAGGITAVMDNGSQLSYCTNYGTVSGTDAVGGLVGVVSDTKSLLSDCVNLGAVTADGASGGAGGAVAQLGGKLLRCANYAPVTGSSWYLGGLVGVCSVQGASSLCDSYSVGRVENAHRYASSGTGGLIGYGNYYTAVNCYAYGTVQAASGFVGGAIGRDGKRASNVRDNLFYLDTASEYAVHNAASADGVSVQTAAQFRSEEFLRLLNRDSCFVLNSGSDYPELSLPCSHRQTEQRGAQDAACTQDGYSGDLVCTLCGAVLQAGHSIPRFACPGAQFIDQPGASNWAHKGLDFCIARGLLSGTSDTTVSPNVTMNRAMLVTVLYSLEGKPEVTAENPFTDVENDRWFSKPVIWAAANGIVSGAGNGKFNPFGNVTREQIAVMLRSYARYKSFDTSASVELSPYPDAGSTSGWAKDALSWAVAEGLISGAASGGATYLNPKNNATRAQVATILMQFVTKVAEDGAETNFS